MWASCEGSSALKLVHRVGFLTIRPKFLGSESNTWIIGLPQTLLHLYACPEVYTHSFSLVRTTCNYKNYIWADLFPLNLQLRWAFSSDFWTEVSPAASILRSSSTFFSWAGPVWVLNTQIDDDWNYFLGTFSSQATLPLKINEHVKDRYKSGFLHIHKQHEIRL